LVYYRKILKTGTSEKRGFYIFTYEDNTTNREDFLLEKLENWVYNQSADVIQFYESVKIQMGYDQELKKRIGKNDKKFIFRRTKKGIE